MTDQAKARSRPLVPLVCVALLALPISSGCHQVTANHLENVRTPWALYNGLSDPVPPTECRWITDTEFHGHQANYWRPWSEAWESPVPDRVSVAPLETRILDEVPTVAPSLDDADMPAMPAEQPIRSIPERIVEPFSDPLSEPMVEPMTEPLSRPRFEPIPEPMAEPMPRPMPESDPFAEPMTKPMSEPESEFDDSTEVPRVHRIPFPPLADDRTELKTMAPLNEVLPTKATLPVRATAPRSTMLEFSDARRLLHL